VAKIGRGSLAGHLFHAAARVSSPRHEHIFVINHPAFTRNLWAFLCAGFTRRAAMAPAPAAKPRGIRCECGAAQLPAAIAWCDALDPRREGFTIFSFPLRVKKTPGDFPRRGYFCL
jgi:hypothetical protein